jgi:hypothetical protein
LTQGYVVSQLPNVKFLANDILLPYFAVNSSSHLHFHGDLDATWKYAGESVSWEIMSSVDRALIVGGINSLNQVEVIKAYMSPPSRQLYQGPPTTERLAKLALVDNNICVLTVSGIIWCTNVPIVSTSSVAETTPVWYQVKSPVSGTTKLIDL